MRAVKQVLWNRCSCFADVAILQRNLDLCSKTPAKCPNSKHPKVKFISILKFSSSGRVRTATFRSWDVWVACTLNKHGCYTVVTNKPVILCSPVYKVSTGTELREALSSGRHCFWEISLVGSMARVSNKSFLHLLLLWLCISTLHWPRDEPTEFGSKRVFKYFR